MNRHLNATELYHHPELKFNCAQAIAYKYASSEEAGQAKALEFKKYGGGNAPDGLCGALHAGLERLSHDQRAEIELKNVFKTSASSLACHEIRKENQLSCKGCVQLVDEFLYSQLS